MSTTPLIDMQQFGVMFADKQEEHTEQIIHETCTGAGESWREEKERVVALPNNQLSRSKGEKSIQLCWQNRGKERDRETYGELQTYKPPLFSWELF